MYNIKLQVKHIKGVDNTYANILSRWSFYKEKEFIHVKHLKACKWMSPDPYDMLPDLEI